MLHCTIAINNLWCTVYVFLVEASYTYNEQFGFLLPHLFGVVRLSPATGQPANSLVAVSTSTKPVSPTSQLQSLNLLLCDIYSLNLPVINLPDFDKSETGKFITVEDNQVSPYITAIAAHLSLIVSIIYLF